MAKRRLLRLGVGLAVAAAVVGLLVYANTRPQQVARLESGQRQMLAALPEVPPAGTRGRTNLEIHVVEKGGRIPADLVPATLEATATTPSSMAIGVRWSYGNCGVPNRETDVYLDETPTEVVVDVWDDVRHDPSIRACGGVGLEGSWTLHLKSPLGSRLLRYHEVVPPPA
ncbi:hypothetical protein EDF46_0937 [Frondihabitans sp. PhB188]|uniref:hypothetical protein n=1 Tax=Frondihabitans sp. PhB188 TaxID=2485200 RepID=UPI000F9DDD9E|nr:hypothetical protein [Frondihabitans sp. PhB188]ROQ41556.1 hypothetical protein EDF46_0937 [Frondihabitans sp. PhB188]